MDVPDEFESLRAQLCPQLECTNDGSHDLSHLERVWRSAQIIQAEEGGNLSVLAAGVWLHDCVTVEKNSPLRDQASQLSAARAGEILEKLGRPASEIERVKDAIAAHSFSAGITPETLEGRILQDADRLDAIGMAGIARCFYTAGRMGSSLYAPHDPKGHTRELDDRRYALDHFPRKLLRLCASFQTAAGARLARERHARLQDFYHRFLEEIGS